MEIHDLEIPLEILVHILEFVPRKDRRENCCYVNKAFYDAVCMIDDSKIKLKLCRDDFYRRNEEKFQSMMAKTRKMSNIQLFMAPRRLDKSKVMAYFEQAHMNRLKDLIENLGPDIKQFEMRGKFPFEKDFIEIISVIPNVESMTLEHTQICESQPAAKKQCIRHDEDLDMPHLKKLKLDDCDEKILNAFKRLPAGVLRELIWNMRIGEQILTEILQKQTNIAKLVTSASFQLDLIDDMKLEELKCKFAMRKQTNEFGKSLQNQKGLKCLRISNVVTDDMMNAIGELKHLDKLEIKIGLISVAAINKMPKVKNLSIVFDDESASKAFAQLDNSHLESFTMVSPINRSVYKSIAASALNLKSARFYFPLNCGTINNIMRTFQQVEILKIFNQSCRDLQDNSEQLCNGDMFNNKLKVLEIHHNFRFSNNFARKIVDSYPNLEKLVILRHSNKLTHVRDQEEDRFARTETLKQLIHLKEQNIDKYPLGV